jgi:hypothetical protein
MRGEEWWTYRNDERSRSKRGEVGGGTETEKDGGDIRRMTEELWKWYDRFTKRLHILCIGKHFIEILSGTFKKKKLLHLTHNEKLQTKQNPALENKRGAMKIWKGNSYTTCSRNKTLIKWHCCYVAYYHKATWNFNGKLLKIFAKKYVTSVTGEVLERHT